MIRRRNLSHICLIIILCFSALEVPIASGNEGESLQNDIGNTIQEKVNQDEIISNNNERSKRGVDKVAVQAVPRRQFSSSSFRCRSFIEGCKSIDVVNPSPIKKESSKTVASYKPPCHESSTSIFKEKLENSDIRNQDKEHTSKKGKFSKWWSKLGKYAAAKGFFKLRLEKFNAIEGSEAFDASEMETLSDIVAQSLVTEGENGEKINESKDTQATKLLASANELRKALWEMIKGSAEGVAEKIRKTRAKGRELVVQYCNCKGINLEKVKAKDLSGYKKYKYAGVLKELVKLVLQKQSADEYVKSLLPFMKTIFFDEEPKEKEQKDAFAKSASRVDNGAIVIRKKRDLGFVIGPYVLCVGAFSGALIFAVVKMRKDSKKRKKWKAKMEVTQTT